MHSITMKEKRKESRGPPMNSTMKAIVEASYLTAPLAAQYRTILRYFYLQHEKMRDYITEEIRIG